ncbi:hypothetical protein GCM10008967_32320 [Bacillus carboniphilus]|uniref:DUF4367 domain-containing protein n=1 Tax=Bacillus carboniphilus TaxID=86663 RepID=A0ABN0WJ33_9BACI
MSKKINSFAEFTEQYKQDNLPQAPSSEKLLIQLKSRYRRSPKLKPFLARSLITAFSIIMMTVSITSAIKYLGWSFDKANGEKTHVNKPMDQQEVNVHEQYDQLMAKWRYVTNEIMRNTPPGQYTKFLSTEAYEQIGLTALTTYRGKVESQKLADIPEFLTSSLDLDDTILNQFIFDRITVYYEDDRNQIQSIEEIDQLAKEMYEEAKEKNEPYSVRHGKLSKEIDFVWLTYKTEEAGQQFTLKAYPDSKKTITEEGLTNHQSVEINGIKVIVNGGRNKAIFIYERNDERVYVEVLMNIDSDDKEETVLEIVESLLK